MNIPPRKGRPLSATSLASAAVNYQALAWQVKQRIESAQQEGRKLKIMEALIEEMLASMNWNEQNRHPADESVFDVRLPTTYIEVRKILSKWKKAEK